MTPKDHEEERREEPELEPAVRQDEPAKDQGDKLTERRAS